MLIYQYVITGKNDKLETGNKQSQKTVKVKQVRVLYKNLCSYCHLKLASIFIIHFKLQDEHTVHLCVWKDRLNAQVQDEQGAKVRRSF